MGLEKAIVTKQYFMPIMVDMLEWCTVKSGHHLSFYFLPLTADWLLLTALVLIISYNNNCFLYKHIAVLSPDQMIYTYTDCQMHLVLMSEKLFLNLYLSLLENLISKILPQVNLFSGLVKSLSWENWIPEWINLMHIYFNSTVQDVYPSLLQQDAQHPTSTKYTFVFSSTWAWYVVVNIHGSTCIYFV